MSADNGIYILKMKDQARVIHTQNIENLWWSYLSNREVANMVPTRILEYYGGAESMTIQEAQEKAKDLYNEIMDDDFCPIVEYGIQIFKTSKTWEQIIKEAKKLAPKEIESLQKKDDSKFYKYEIRMLKNIIKE